VPAGRYVSIAVADTGMGMSKEIMSHIFEPFFTTKDSEHGTGLGLASVYSCVNSHKGHITVESTEGKGTSFRLYFPFTKEHLSGTSDENDSY
jgi:signal transduction histidine kinase